MVHHGLDSACISRRQLRRNVLLIVVLSIQGRVFLELAGLPRRQHSERITKAVHLPFDVPEYRHKPEAAVNSNVLPEKFPRWSKKGISINNLLHYMDVSSHGRNFSVNLLDVKSRQTDSFVFPETLYVIDREDVWTAASLRKYNRATTAAKGIADFAKYRAQPTERIMMLALERLRSDPTAAAKQWPKLTAAILDGEGIPFLTWYGDFKSCNYHNWNSTYSIPLFTTCAKVTCNYAWPFPTYKTIKDSQAVAASWEEILKSYETSYPWDQKKKAVVWRGGLTGLIKNYTSPRARIARFGKQHRHESFLDIGLTGVPEKVLQYSKPNMRLLGGLHKPISPMEDFQKYIGIIDIDGNSWSSRFGKLLCYNSVVLKVEPQYVDYFHLKDLVPWKHYIPVKGDLSDLLAMAQFAVDPQNEGTVKEVVRNATEWCRTRMVYDSIAQDVLDIWEKYVSSLNRGDPHWMKRWKKAKKKIYSDFAYNMAKLTDVVPDLASPRLRMEGDDAHAETN